MLSPWEQLLNDVRSLLKLAVLVFILTQRDPKPKTIALYSAVAFGFFLHQTGRLDWLWNILPSSPLSVLAQRMQRPNVLIQSGQQAVEDEVRNRHTTGGHDLSQRSRLSRVLRHAGITLSAYLLSLNPGWDPIIAQREHQE